MKKFTDILKAIKSNKLPFEMLKSMKNEFVEYSEKVLTRKVEPNSPELKAFLQLALDYYTHSIEGDVLIPDTIYDRCMSVYISEGNERLIFPSEYGKTKWNFVDHRFPGLVGSIDKIYSYKELKEYLLRDTRITKYTLAPKYDGVSCAIEVQDGEIVSAVTRYNGIVGQNILDLVVNCSNAKTLPNYMGEDGFYKCELCVNTIDFEKLCEEKKYANRRAATSAIVNTPSNLKFAKYVTIVPLLFCGSKSSIIYDPPGAITEDFYSPGDMMDKIEAMLETFKSKDFLYRVDGIVIYPDPNREKVWTFNMGDVMDGAIAYKINTSEAKTTIVEGYMSVGRLGKAIPMLKVEPVEVNETVVTDVSLGSYAKFLSMGLKEGDEVVVYSAGDVIPQVKLPEIRTDFDNAPDLRIPRVCPYCGKKLTREGMEYFCTNDDCIRVVSGKISNFLIKLGMSGFSDKSIELIVECLGVNNVVDILSLTIDDIMRIPGFDTTSAENLMYELNKIKSTPVSSAKFFGALGISKISEKKCRKILDFVTVEELLGGKDLKRIFWELQNSDGIGGKTAQTFIEYIATNMKEIKKLYSLLNVVGNKKFIGNIVFTGFRPSEALEKIFVEDFGIEVSDTVTSHTLYVVSASLDKESSKTKAAKNKGIPVIGIDDVDNLIYYLNEDRRRSLSNK